MRCRSHPLGILLVGTMPWIIPKATKGARGGGGQWEEGWAVPGSSHLPGLHRAGPLHPRCVQPSRRKHPGSGRESLLKGNRPINKSRHLKNEARGLGEGVSYVFFPFSQLKQTKLKAQEGLLRALWWLSSVAGAGAERRPGCVRLN